MSNVNDAFSDHLAMNVKPAFNIFPMIDLLTGTWIIGDRGEDILVGGYQHHSGFLASANAGKTALGLTFFCTAMNRHSCMSGQIYETESTLGEDRVEGTSLSIPTGQPFEVDDNRVSMIDGLDLFFDKWFDLITIKSEERNKERATGKNLVTLPYTINRRRGNKMLPPYLAFIDSWSEAQVTSADEKSAKKSETSKAGGIDHKDGQTEFMRDGWVKTKIGQKLGRLMTNGDIFVISTCSLDNSIEMGGMPGAHPEKQMAHLKSGKKMKGTGTSYKKLSSNMWTFSQPKPLFKGTGSADKYPKYPANKDDNFLGNVDLEHVTFLNTRGKSGGSGASYTLVRSQRGGVLPTVTELEFLNKWGSDNDIKGYGISSGGQYQFVLDMYPDVKWRNTNFREISDNDALLRKAVEFTMAMKMMFHSLMDARYMKYKCTPKELFDDISKLGYDWKKLLDTRSYWLFLEEEEGELPFLSILTLLKVRAGDATISWYPQPKK